MGKHLRRPRRVDECRHVNTIETISSGLSRVVCEGCGHLSIRPLASAVSEVDRSRFARRQ
jgi:hypothetical protein